MFGHNTASEISPGNFYMILHFLRLPSSMYLSQNSNNRAILWISRNFSGSSLQPGKSWTSSRDIKTVKGEKSMNSLHNLDSGAWADNLAPAQLIVLCACDGSEDKGWCTVSLVMMLQTCSFSTQKQLFHWFTHQKGIHQYAFSCPQFLRYISLNSYHTNCKSTLFDCCCTKYW